MNPDFIITFSNSSVALPLAEEIFDAVARWVTADEHKRYQIRSALSELFSNAFLHGEKDSMDNRIEFRACFSENRLFAAIINEGKGITDIDLSNIQFPHPQAESGRGLKIVQNLCEKVEFKMLGGNKFGVFIELDISKENKVKNI